MLSTSKPIVISLRWFVIYFRETRLMEIFIAAWYLTFIEFTLFNISFVSLRSYMVISVFSFTYKAYPFIFLAIPACEFDGDFLELLFWIVILHKNFSCFTRKTIHINPSSFSAESAFWMETSFAASNTELAASTFIATIT